MKNEICFFLNNLKRNKSRRRLKCSGADAKHVELDLSSDLGTQRQVLLEDRVVLHDTTHGRVGRLQDEVVRKRATVVRGVENVAVEGHLRSFAEEGVLVEPRREADQEALQGEVAVHLHLDQVGDSEGDIDERHLAKSVQRLLFSRDVRVIDVNDNGLSNYLYLSIFFT